MTTKSSPFRRITRARTSRRARNQSGIALVTTLLLLILVSILGLAMAVTTNSDMLINSYYGSYRGSFYAADSGLNIARAALVNQLKGQVNMTACPGWQTGSPPSGCAAAPLNGATAASTAQSYLTTTYSSFSSLNAGQASNSWPGNFLIPASISGTTTSCTTSVTLASGGATHQNAQLQNDIYVYTFNYELCSVGRAQALQQVNTKEDGSAIITITAQTAGSAPTLTSFAAFGAFIDHFNPCQGALVDGTMSGPFFTNGAWNFGTGGAYIFTDPVGQGNANVSYWISGNCYQSPTSSYTRSGTTIAPTFQQGLNRSQPHVDAPTNDFSQKWAVLDGMGCGEAGTTCGVSTPPNPTNTDLNANLKNISGTSYPTGGATSGVYIPYCTGGAGCSNPYTFNGGGFFIEDNGSISTNIVLSIGTAGGNPTQIYTITQGSTTTTITLNINANTTTVVSGATTLNLTGVPKNLTGATPQEGALLYVDGTISSLRGTGQGVAGIQDYYGTTIAAASNIYITGDLIYRHEPVTLNTSDALISGNDFNQVLGVFTNNGNIVLSSPYGNQNLETDASLAAINATCPGGSSSCGFATSGHINTWTIVGGRIESYAHGVSISTGNTYFDRRFTARQGFGPPWFPSTTIPANDLTNTPLTPNVGSTAQRTTWVTWPQ